jgi:predicted NAD/FAD-dependent oxidoreductase
MATTAAPRVAVVGGGLAGTLCSLVLKNRGIHPVLIDAGTNGVGGRLRNGGAQFLRTTDPRLVPVFQMLHREGLLQEWKGRFGMLGSKEGGFLPAEIVANNEQGSGRGAGGIMGLQKAQNDDLLGGQVEPTVSATDSGDFCQFVEGSRAPAYVGIPSMTQLCPEICRLADIQQVNHAKMLRAKPRKEGGWSVSLENNDIDESFDALVLATHDPSMASSAIKSIVDAEAQAGGYDTVQDAVDASNDDASLVIQRLLEISDSLQRVRDNDKLPVYSISLTYPPGFSDRLPFDAVSIPGSRVVQFLSREASKPGRVDNAAVETWTAITTSQCASTILDRHDLSDDEKKNAVVAAVTQEISHLVSKYHASNSTPDPIQVFVKRWGAAFCSQGLQLKENSIFLAPWRFCIAGDFIRDLSAFSTPLEAAALSGLEAGERMSSLWTVPTTS